MTTERIEHITTAAELNPEDARQYAVIGRRPDDDEPSALIVTAVDDLDARDYFADWLWENGKGVWDDRSEAEDAYGTAIFTTAILSCRAGSELRIEELES